MRVILTSYGSEQAWQLDTPDPSLVGTWLKSIFDDYQGTPYYYPVEFTLKVSG